MTYPRYYNARIETMRSSRPRSCRNGSCASNWRTTIRTLPFIAINSTRWACIPKYSHACRHGKAPLYDKEELRDSQLEHPPWGDMPRFQCRGFVRIHSSSARRDAPAMSASPGMTAIPGSSPWRASTGRGVRPDSIIVMGFGMSFFVAACPCTTPSRNRRDLHPCWNRRVRRLITRSRTWGQPSLPDPRMPSTWRNTSAINSMSNEYAGIRRIQVARNRAACASGAPEHRRGLGGIRHEGLATPM